MLLMSSDSIEFAIHILRMHRCLEKDPDCRLGNIADAGDNRHNSRTDSFVKFGRCFDNYSQICWLVAQLVVWLVGIAYICCVSAVIGWHFSWLVWC